MLLRMFKVLILVCILLILPLPSQSLITNNNMIMKRRGIKLSVASSDSPTDSVNKVGNIISSVLSGITLCLTINLTSDVGGMKTEITNVQTEITNVQTEMKKMRIEITSVQSNAYITNSNLSDLKYRFDAFGIGSAVSLGVFAGSGNIVKVLEYFDKKEEKNDKLK